MRKSYLILLLALSGCLATSSKENLGRPDFSKPRPPKPVAAITTKTNHSFSIVDSRTHVAVIGGRRYFVFKETHFQDLGPVQSGSKK